MKQFLFRLQAVLMLREQAEQTAKLRCARAYAVVNEAATRLRLAEEAMTASHESRRNQLVAGARAEHIEQLRAFGARLSERQISRMHELSEARLRAEDATRLLVLATQERESLERLRRRQQSQHTYRAACAEQKDLDELAGHGQTFAETWRETVANV